MKENYIDFMSFSETMTTPQNKSYFSDNITTHHNQHQSNKIVDPQSACQTQPKNIRKRIEFRLVPAHASNFLIRPGKSDSFVILIWYPFSYPTVHYIEAKIKTSKQLHQEHHITLQ